MYYKVNGQATQETIGVILIMLWNQKKMYYTLKNQVSIFGRNKYCVLPVT